MRVNDFVNAEVEVSGEGADINKIFAAAAKQPATVIQHASCGGSTFPVFGAPK